ncbi:hypothetical protein NHX12_003718 [Muraenolepis orangiensis]|uniref:Uncharacterized protein n=1 Tax=Muraenolepis orangiensis TaxID=630683 RepID=A0A9Q0DTX7_9TELE|nr:hypothetical protein NHX12_003718 [Muraenolepis orangiensis]
MMESGPFHRKINPSEVTAARWEKQRQTDLTGDGATERAAWERGEDDSDESSQENSDDDSLEDNRAA